MTVNHHGIPPGGDVSFITIAPIEITAPRRPAKRLDGKQDTADNLKALADQVRSHADHRTGGGHFAA